jgi:replicative DNA helicase
MNARTEQHLDDELATLRKPPHSLEAEQAVLGSILQDNGALDRCGDLLSEADFYAHPHRLVWAAVGSLINACKAADTLTVFEHLRGAGKHEDAGGLSYLNALCESVPSSASVRYYATIVRDKAVERSLIAASDQVATLAFAGQQSAAEKLDRAASIFADLQQGSMRHLPVDAGTLSVRLIDRLNERHEGSGPQGIPTGIRPLDDALNGGLREGRVYVLAARPSVGKSSLAQAIAIHVSMNEGHTALLLSQEMEADECMDRAAANVAGVDYASIQTGQLTDIEWGLFAEGIEKLSKTPLYIDDQASLTLDQIRGKAAALRREKLKLLVLDYLQLSDYAAERGQSTNDALGKLSKGLKRLAKDLHIAVIVLSQLNREVEKRGTPEPHLSDLRDSGAIEQDADVVAMLWQARQWSDRQIMGLSLPKNRQGKKGQRIALEFFGQYQRWRESDADISPPNRTESKKGFE